ncbi:insulinase family protein [Candidatus Peregrinibacteria bacterium]|nr:insulinase family protein [Candidatus Peregrinibacteria bacterium]
MHQSTTLKNGLRIITTPIEGTKSVTVLCLVGAGSRYENKKISGISHFLEHLFFKGAERYQNAAEVASAIDSVGGDFNAFTGKEYAGYYVKLASHKKEVAFDVIGDMMLNATFLPHEIDKERGVILEEYNMYQDTPMYQVGWDFEKLLFGDQPMGWDQIGEKAIIKSLTRDQIVDYKEALYTPDNTIVSVAGDITEKEAKSLVEKYFPFEEIERGLEPAPYRPVKGGDKAILQEKKTEQAHIIVGVEGMPARHKDNYTEKILSIILGGNMSSRMFLNVREAKGLAYYIRTTTDDYTDTGTLSTAAGVDLTRIDLAIEAILVEYRKVMEKKVGDEELKKAKDFMKGKIILRLEDSEEYAHLMGKQALLFPKIDTLEDILHKIDAVTADDILRLSRKILEEKNLRVALIGPYKDKEHFSKLLHY